jgi:hypothetical protein
MAQDTAGRRPVCHGTRARQTAFRLIVVRAVPFNEDDKGDCYLSAKSLTPLTENVLQVVYSLLD